jgi:SAM-dependent methyltransferase
MKKFFPFFFLFVVMRNSTAMQNSEIPALQLLKECAHMAIPEKLLLERYATLNEHGYIFYITSPIAQHFIDDSETHKRFLEIGSGFSQTTEKCLRKGIGEYTANDLSLEHLKILSALLQKAFANQTETHLNKLKLLPGRIPDVLTPKENYYDGILMDKVLHFFTPQDSEKFLAWAHKALKPNGKLYIFTLSPFNTGHDNMAALYQQQKLKTDFYPGYVENVKPYMRISDATNPNYAVPNNRLFFMLEDLKKLLESKNFTIRKTFTTRLPREETPFWVESEEEQCDLVGIIAQKPEHSLT